METTDEPRWLTVEERGAWLTVVTLMSRLPSSLDAQLQRTAGITFFEYMVLAMLAEQDDRTMQMSDLARITSASLSRLSHVAGRLEQQGLIERRRLGGAGRRTEAVLSDAGLARVEAAAPGHVATVRSLLIDALTPDEQSMLQDLGTRLAARLEQPDLASGP